MPAVTPQQSFIRLVIFSSLFSLILGGLGAGVLYYYFLMESRPTSISASIGGPFQLRDVENRLVEEKDVKGHPFLVFFGFTHCPDICPTTLSQLSELLQHLKSEEKISVLFVTVDPERDTPAVLKNYLAPFDSRILGLSGSPAAIESMVKNYHAYAKKVPLEGGNYTVDHTALIYLMDKKGVFVRGFNLQQPVEQAVKELRALL